LLRRAIERRRVGHAYLFAGDTLAELEELAQAFATSLNCTGDRPETANGLDACGACTECAKIRGFNHPDIMWVRPESKSRIITIDQIRGVLHAVNLKPTHARWKVAVLSSADRMNVQAANAFLKTLEEPPPHSLLILLSTEPQRLLETILSRCLRLTVGDGSAGITDTDDAQWLAQFSSAAAVPQTSLLNRFRLLDTLLARLTDIRKTVERDLSVRSPLETYEDAEPELREKWEDELAAGIEAEYRKRRSELLNTIHWWLRDVWVFRTTNESSIARLPQFSEQTAQLAARLSPLQTLENLNVLERTRRLLETNVQESLALEVGLLKLNL
jgi:DNA polymerase-3 subunit delta'